jgi:FkbM family methyltransferase
MFSPIKIYDIAFASVLSHVMTKERYRHLLAGPALMLRSRFGGFAGKDEVFHRFYMEAGEDAVRGRFERLVRSLDRTSIEAARRMFANYLHMHNNEAMEVEEETAESPSQIDRAIHEFCKNSAVPPYIFAPARPEVFFYHSGLRYVPTTIRESHIDGKDILDCGAYDGDSALAFSKLYEPRRIYSFEPDPTNFRKLLDTVDMCRLNEVVPVRKGVGKTKTKAKIVSDDSASRVDCSEHAGQEVEMTDIDSFVAENNASPGLIKMDIEGHETKAIEGAIGSIRRFRPILLVAIYHSPEDFFGIKPMLEKQVGGYRFIIRHLTYIYPTYETFLIAYPER